MAELWSMRMIAVREEHDDPHLQRPIQPQRRMGRHWPVKSGKAMARTGLAGIELGRARCRWRVTVPALSIAGRVHNSTMTTFP
jgi:hypothetical protein